MLPNYRRFTRSILKRLGESTQIGDSTFNAYYRQIDDYTDNTEMYRSTDVILKMSEADFDAETMVVRADVHNLDNGTRWIIKTAPLIRTGEVEFGLAQKVVV